MKIKYKNILVKSKTKYNINIDPLLHIPANVYWKDLNGIYLGCNEQNASDTGLSNSKDYVGLSIYDISKPDTAKIIDNTDRRIMVTGRTECTLEYSDALLTKEGVYFSLKMPLYTVNNLTVGMLGISFRLNENNLITTAEALKNIQITSGLSIISDTFFRISAAKYLLHQAGLSPKETKILFGLCEGKSAKEIAKILNISYRTVETHIEHIKLKTNCNTKYQLIDKFSILKIVT
ncbi:MAG: LuxR C-terminal-related transcriptional regulator [Gammaproteobacteria bacterium]|nr:LuxR C-terminal-related transcriptional regulator [Gammaproteobacteria bacterium]